MRNRNPPTGTSASGEKVKRLRATMAPAETLLWQRLRSKQLAGWKFRRQEPIGSSLVDFLCFESRLIRELDGASHEERFERDKQRDNDPARLGYHVLRCHNREVYENLSGVLETIEKICNLRKSLTQLPPEGEEFNHPIILVGFMGCGKSSVARALAARLGLEACDIDTLIEDAAGMPVAEIFAQYGEDEFRRQETVQLGKALEHSSTPRVIATGGGIVTWAQNRTLLQAAVTRGIPVVYLRTSPAVLAARIRLQPGKRPLIDGEGELNLHQTQMRVSELLQQRAPLYESVAGFTVDTDGLAVSEVVRKIEAASRKMQT